MPSSKEFPNPGIEPRSPALQVNSLPAEPQGKPKDTEVGSLSLPQRIFLTGLWLPSIPGPSGTLISLVTDSTFHMGGA